MINKKMKILLSSLCILGISAVIVPTVVSCANNSGSNNSGSNNSGSNNSGSNNSGSNNSGFVTNLKKDDLFTYATTNPFVQSVVPQETFNSLKAGTNMFLDGSNQIIWSSITEDYTQKVKQENNEIITNWNLNFLNIKDNYISYVVSSYVSVNRLTYLNGNKINEQVATNKFTPIIVTYMYNPGSTSQNGTKINEGWFRCVFEQEVPSKPGSSEIANDLDGYLNWYKTSYVNNKNNWSPFYETDIKNNILKMQSTNETVKQFFSGPNLNFETKTNEYYQKSSANVNIN